MVDINTYVSKAVTFFPIMTDLLGAKNFKQESVTARGDLTTGTFLLKYAAAGGELTSSPMDIAKLSIYTIKDMLTKE